MNIFEKVHIEGFRRLHDVEIKLASLNVVIGANGSGKTSLLDVFSLLAASASGRLKEAISDLSGIEANLTNVRAAKGDRARSMGFHLSMSVPHHKPIDYRIAMTPRGVGYEISEETLTQQRDNRPEPFKHIEAHQGDVRYFEHEGAKKGLVRPNWEYNPTESALSQVPKMFQEPEDFRKRLASSTHYHVLDVGRRAPIRLPQQMRDAQLPGHDGEDLVSCLYTVRETDPDRFETIEATLRAGFPEFERLNFPPVAAGTLAMTWKDTTSQSPFYMHQLSEGTLRFLWLATLLQSPGLTAVTMIDEPEVSLHPELLSLLADLLREASQRTQFIVATHADRLIRFLKPAEVLTIDVTDDGAAHVTRADELDLDDWLEECGMESVPGRAMSGPKSRLDRDIRTQPDIWDEGVRIDNDTDFR
ncbi:MAG TPA: AAA family ATPase [Pirellulales bacterium]|nr:AAA family ATPase [Pirellulales bacterium]